MATNNSGITFQPYGVLAQDEAPGDDRLIPQDWMPLKGDKGNTRHEQFDHWFAQVMSQLNEFIWPTWSSKDRRWIHSPALAHAEALTSADFAVLAQMAVERVNRGLDQLPDAPNRSKDIRSQRAIFEIEDDRIADGESAKVPFASYYNTYDSKLDPAYANAVSPQFGNAVRHKIAHQHYHFKALLQRPRAYQTALLLGYPDFVTEKAETGCTPSACSGHCIQGVTGMGGVYEFFLQSAITLDDNNLLSLQQYAVDIGDRRVMAGVHYPSDNLSSWIIFMNLADRVYRRPEVKCFIWQAIQNRSFVYHSIVKYVAENASTAEGKALARPLKHLQKIAPKGCD